MHILKKLSALCIFGVLFLTAGCAKASNPGFYLYKSSPIGFQIEYPDAWSKEVDNSDKVVAFLTPTEGFGDVYRDNVTISRAELGEESFDKYYENYYASLPSTFAGFTEKEKADVLVGEKEARRITFTSTTETTDDNEEKNTVSLQIKQYIVHADTYVFFITYIAAPGSFDYFEPFFNTMLETVKFTV